MSATPLPPGPPSRGLTGNLTDFRRDPLGYLARCAREYGDAVPLRFVFRRALLLSDPAAIEAVLAVQHRAFGKSFVYRRLRPLLGEGLLTSDGETWRRSRRLVQPAFHRERVAAAGELMVAAAERQIAAWRDGEVRNLQAELQRVTLAVAARALFGVDLDRDAGGIGAALTEVLQRFSDRSKGLGFLLPEWLPTPGNRRSQRAIARLDAVIYDIIARRRASGEDPGDVLSLLLRARDAEDGGALDDRQVRDEVMTLLLAGHETTATALGWTWYLLAQHPEVDARLADELREALGGRPPTVADRPRLGYAERVLTEAMRLYPPSWIIEREALADCEVGGYRVPAGTTVLMSQWVVHRDPRYYPDPEVFDPDRWAGGQAARLPKFAYFPFGGGPRHCLGSAFALQEALLVLATVAARYRFSLVPDRPATPWPTVTLRPRDGIYMTVHRR
ncbi:MAG TPA: cytochrome P450 [Thermomicrobiales bacterium]|nr:cytochrome P450 [Thermomicrobiales bacterium]